VGRNALKRRGTWWWRIGNTFIPSAFCPYIIIYYVVLCAGSVIDGEERCCVVNFTAFVDL
jgi:hypothetical protein